MLTVSCHLRWTPRGLDVREDFDTIAMFKCVPSPSLFLGRDEPVLVKLLVCLFEGQHQK